MATVEPDLSIAGHPTPSAPYMYPSAANGPPLPPNHHHWSASHLPPLPPWGARTPADITTADAGWSEQFATAAVWPGETQHKSPVAPPLVGSTMAPVSLARKRRRGRSSGASSAAKCVAKHVPHRDKPPIVVERRNARERRRVEAVNSAFGRLRKAVPIENTRGKRVSKVKTLQKAIEYISALQDLLRKDGIYYEPIHYDTYFRFSDTDEYCDDVLSNEY